MLSIRGTRGVVRALSRPTMLKYPVDNLLYAPLQEVDPEIHNLIELERQRQFRGLELIASEVWP